MDKEKEEKEKKVKDYWNEEENKVFFEKYILSIQQKEWNDIIANWSVSSLKLKNWLNKYFPTEYGKYDTLCDININYILPYQRRGRFWSGKDLWRLEYAIKAKLIILGQYGLDEVRTQYVVECLRLWLRYDSTKTPLKWSEFRNLVDKCYIDTELDWEGTVKKCQDICYKYKPRRKQTMYHFTETDFKLVNGMDFTLKEAYEYWLIYEFPNILENYKRELTKKFIKDQLKMYNKVNEEKLKKFNEDLDLINIRKPSRTSFKCLLNSLGISYKKLYNNRKI